MKTVFTLICLISAVHYATADCSALKTFTTELQPACSPNDIYVKWPNYANQSTFYTCAGVGNPVLTSCPSDQYFIYVLQICGSCSDYIPPVSCDKLKTQNTPVCVAIGSGTQQPGGNNSSTSTTSGYPTPNYPDTTTTTARPGRTTTTKTTTTATDSSTTTTPPTPPTPPSESTPQTPPTPPTAPTPPTIGSGSTTTAFPGPPSPVTSDPNVPTPPTPAPTPPTVENEPPIVGMTASQN